MDDDVTVESNWLRNLTAGLGSDEWAGAGGRILPAWACKPPSWLPEKEWFGMAPLVMFDLGPEAGPLTVAPFGTNMAFHRRMFEKYGTFRTDLGPRPNSEIRNEDTEFARRLLAGEPLRYEPATVVHHAVPQNRLRKDFFLKWWYDRGRPDVRENRVPADTKWFVSGIPLYLFRKLAVGTLRWMVTLDPRNDSPMGSRYGCLLGRSSNPTASPGWMGTNERNPRVYERESCRAEIVAVRK